MSYSDSTLFQYIDPAPNIAICLKDTGLFSDLEDGPGVPEGSLLSGVLVHTKRTLSTTRKKPSLGSLHTHTQLKSKYGISGDREYCRL